MITRNAFSKYALGFSVSKELIKDDMYSNIFKKEYPMIGCNSNETEKKDLFIKSEPKVEFYSNVVQVKWNGHFSVSQAGNDDELEFTLDEIEQLEKAIKMLKPVAKKYAARVRKEAKAKCKKQCDVI